jgi:hypothetical protein
MEEQDRDNRYSEPCYFDAEQGIWVNAHYEPIELPSTRHPLHETCSVGKQARKKFSTDVDKVPMSSQIGERIHTDICGPIPLLLGVETNILFPLLMRPPESHGSISLVQEIK